VKLEWSPRALENLEKIALYIAQDDPEAAHRWVMQLFRAVEKLDEFPLSGRVVPELGSDQIREIVHGDYRVVYRVDERVHVLTVRHARRVMRFEE
jgi:toxin ParE1/3/4